MKRFSSACTVEKPTYTLHGAAHTATESVSILEVQFARALDFGAYVASVVAKSCWTLGFVSHVTKQCYPYAFSLLYTSLVLQRGVVGTAAAPCGAYHKCAKEGLLVHKMRRARFMNQEPRNQPRIQREA
ncbi:hypothetical protein HPB48_001258 [Haemaphysalis longicornis]|uniref:Uncharacterized protein n=1 Tax=Haemaphysalis longicornis TaxID=44386 RepID=A0A9J6FI03_HAELO|nr:hypothetical protein HPB48_001258 [Haemaphysalis longicornis]